MLSSPMMATSTCILVHLDPIARASIAIMLGCDAFPGEIPGIGPKAAFCIFQKFNGKSGQHLNEELATLMSQKACMKGQDQVIVTLFVATLPKSYWHAVDCYILQLHCWAQESDW